MSEQRKFFKNSFSMLVSRLAQSVTTFVLTATIARTLGADALGQYLLAFSFYYIFMSITSQGLKVFFTRELSRAPLEVPAYLINGTLLQFIFSAIGYLALVIVVYLLPYSAGTKTICYIMGLTIFPFSLSNITEAIFQAQERMHLIAIATVPVYVLRLLIMIWLLDQQYQIKYLAVLIALSETLVLFVEWILLLRTLNLQWRVRWDVIQAAVYSSRTFVAIEAVGIIASKLQILMLSLLGSELLVGIYGGIEQLMQPFYIVCNSLLIAAFPKMSKTVELGREKQRKTTENILEMLLCIALPLSVGLLFFADKLLGFVYKDLAFQQGVKPLQLTALTLVTFTFLRTLGYVLLANGFEKFNLIEVSVATLLGGVAGIFWIPQYKLMGAAYVTLLMSSTSAAIFVYVVCTRLFPLHLWNFITRPLVIVIMMLPIFVILSQAKLSFLMVLIITVFTYVFLSGLIGVHALGGSRAAYDKLFEKGKL